MSSLLTVALTSKSPELREEAMDLIRTQAARRNVLTLEHGDVTAIYFPRQQTRLQRVVAWFKAVVL